jgi:hypothetical protein
MAMEIDESAVKSSQERPLPIPSFEQKEHWRQPPQAGVQGAAAGAQALQPRARAPQACGRGTKPAS